MNQCKECKFWHESESECRFHAPQGRLVAAIAAGDNCYADWPRTLPSDWCGKYEAKEPVKAPSLPMQQPVIEKPSPSRSPRPAKKKPSQS